MPTTNNTSNISTPAVGMNTDIYYLNKDGKSYAFAYNAMVGDFFEGNEFQLQNEPSTFISVQFPPGYRVIGFEFAPSQNRTIFALVNPTTGSSQIGEVINCNFIDKTDQVNKGICKDCDFYSSPEILPLEQQKVTPYCSYTALVTSSCLNFNINYPVDIQVKLTNCSFNIYITDAYNERRFMYFNYTNGFNSALTLQNRFRVITGSTSGSCPIYTYSNNVDCNKILFNPSLSRPCVEYLSLANAGNLKQGDYEILIAYADASGNPLSNYFPSSQIIPIFDIDLNGNNTLSTGKGISFRINNLSTDLLFNFYNIVVAETVNNFTVFKQVGTFPTTQTSYIYTGYENTIKVVDATVLTHKTYYQYAKSFTTANEYLFNTDVQEYPYLNLQPVANQLTLEWCTVAIQEHGYFDPANVFYFRGYMRDEVYPFAIVFEFDNGDETCAFHIPGRVAINTDLNIITNNDVIQSEDCNTTQPAAQPMWQVYNTGNVIGGEYIYNNNCNINNCWQYGQMAYWQSTELYPQIPEIWGDLCGQPIRHHKFPDNCVTHIHDNANTTTGTFASYTANNYIFPIGVRLNPTSVTAAIAASVTAGVITQADANRIVSYRIVRGNRVGNKSVQCKGLLYNVWHYTKYGNTYYYSNYPYNDLTPDNFLAPSNATYTGSNTSSGTPTSYNGDNTRFTFHSPDTSFTEPQIGSILKLETEEYGTSEGFFTHSDCQASFKLISEFAQILALGLAVASALSASGEKQCQVVTYQGNDKIDAYSTSTSGNTPVGIVTGTSPGATATTVVNSPFSANTNIPDVTVEHNNLSGVTQYNNNGQPYTNPLGANVASFQATQCTGQPFQEFNTNPIIAVLLAPFGAIIPSLAQIIQQVILALNELTILTAALKALIPYRNYAIQYDSIGKYNNFTCVPATGFKIRPISIGVYLDPILQTINEPVTNSTSNPVPNIINSIEVNNWNRESSVYLKTPTAFPFNNITDHADNSRIRLSDVGGYSNLYDGQNSAGMDGDGSATNPLKFYRNISSYYASIKNYIPNQYGEICNIEYLETSGCSFRLDNTYTACQTQVFGGDTFINRFALKRKLPFFLTTTCHLPNDSDIKYDYIGNVAFPNYYFQSFSSITEALDESTLTSLTGIASILGDILGVPKSRLDCKKTTAFYQDGYMYVYNYGIPYFLVESDINIDYRYATDTKANDFYPHTTDLKNWMEEGNVSITNDNKYLYDTTFSKQNKESTICTDCILTQEELDCANITNNRLIYSEPSTFDSNSDGDDGWLIYKPDNYKDFPLNYGKIISADGIEDEKVLVRLENASQIFNAYDEIESNANTIAIGTGGIFKSRPKDLGVTDLGYAGTQHKSMLHTEFGHIWADAKRGQIFNLGTGATAIDELGQTGMKNWFKENLPFQIKRDFPTIEDTDLDNNFKGIGLHFSFDKRFHRFLLTKLDYKVINHNVQYDTATKVFYIGTIATPVELTDKRYFCNKSWTISYNFFTKSWTSFHGYLPNYYIDYIDYFDSGFTQNNIQGLYSHNVSNKSYQVFYGQISPFIVEFYSTPDGQNNFLNSFEYYLDVIRYHNEFDAVYSREITFNKAIIYNERQCSGLLNLIVSNPENLNEILEYPKRVFNGYEVLVKNSENVWRINDFWDTVNSQRSNIPFFTYDCANVNKGLNNINYDKSEFDRARIRQRMCRVRLINDLNSNYKFIISFALINETKSIR